MKLRNSVNGNIPFEGDRIFRWQAIPVNAKILGATATVTPVDSGINSPFAETLGFSAVSPNFGATKIVAAPWVEVDFHTRRTLASVAGNFSNATLQVDVGGGTYVEINSAGAFKTPTDPPTANFVVNGSQAALPALTVAKVKLTNSTTAAPNLTDIIIRSVPANVSLRVGELAPFWTHVGEMTRAETTKDFAAVLQAALTTAKVENGFYDLALIVHSDSIARLKIELEIEVLAQQEVLSKAVPEIVLPFDSSTLSKSKAAELSIEVPFNSRVVQGQTSARIKGAFTETRIAHGPTGADQPTAAVEVSPTYSQAQIVAFKDPKSPLPDVLTLKDEVAAVAVDLLLEALTPSARLQLDIRGDFDGKPDEIPLLPQPIEFSIEQQAEKGPVWTTVPLLSEFLFAKGQGKPSRYWLLLQSVEGRAAWSVLQIPKSLPEEVATEAGASGFKKEPTPNTQFTRNGALSWQDTSLISNSLRVPNATPPFLAFFRLRDKPKTFKMPIQLQVGSGAHEVRKKLDRFEPLGRVEFTLDTELVDGINKYLTDVGALSSAETEHLVNGDFERWVRVGQEPVPQQPIDLTAAADAVVFSIDGSVAHVLDQGPLKKSLLLNVDVACSREVKEKALSLETLTAPDFPFSDPNALVISPDGTKAYVTNGRRIRMVDLVANQVIGGTFDLSDLGVPSFVDPARDLVLSPDGQRLYVVRLKSITDKFNAVGVIDTAKLEQQLRTGVVQSGVETTHEFKNALAPTQILSPPGIGLSPDGAILYWLIDFGPTTKGVIRRINTNTFALQGADIEVGIKPSAIALSPDGSRAVVVHETSNFASVVDTATNAVDEVPVDAPHVDVAISADGARAYVLPDRSDKLVSMIDVSLRSVKRFALTTGISPAPLKRFALAPGEDHIYAIVSGVPLLLSVQMGTLTPSGWQRTSGEVRLVCMPKPFHLIAELGSDSLPTSLSQVVPVAASRPYEFSFWGIASEPLTDEPPLAEVLWLNSTCGLLATDAVPIETFVPDPSSPTNSGKPQLVFHRLTTRIVNGETQPLTSPPGAEQAEVRFTVGKEEFARVDQVSLGVTSELAANSDFKLQTKGQLADWTLKPSVAPGFSVTGTEGGLQLRNLGGATAELVQTVAAETGRPFTLEFQGKSLVESPVEPARVELRWLKSDSSAAGDVTVLKILPTGLDSLAAGGSVPPGSAKVEIHVIVPAKTTIEVKHVSLRYAKSTTVPVKFVAESPGDLVISDVRIAFEEVPPQTPPIPQRGLCTATAPGNKPGEKGGCCFCHKCGEETVMTETTSVMTAEGQPATMARCKSCKTELLSVGGPLVAAAEPLPLRKTMLPQPVIVIPAPLNPVSPAVGNASPSRLIDIPGIGKARAKQLTEIGIDSVEKLAASTPEKVREIKFITHHMATNIITEAKSRLPGATT